MGLTMVLRKKHNEDQSSAYQLNVIYGDEVIGVLSLDSSTHLLKLAYSANWQQSGFAISPHLALNNNQLNSTVAYNYLDNTLPEGEARQLLAGNLGDGRDVKHIRDGASLEKLFEFTVGMSSPIESKQWLINWQLFNLMISNYDSHGKNVSLFFDKTNVRFTPAYDLVNIAMFSQFKHVLAMAMGDEFEPNDINAYQLADFAETCNIDKKLLSRLLVSLSNLKIIPSLMN